jgi:hypothetical protein
MTRMTLLTSVSAVAVPAPPAQDSRVSASGNPPLEADTRVLLVSSAREAVHDTATVRAVFGSAPIDALLSCDLCFREAPTVRRTYPGSSSTTDQDIRPGSFN